MIWCLMKTIKIKERLDRLRSAIMENLEVRPQSGCQMVSKTKKAGHGPLFVGGCGKGKTMLMDAFCEELPNSIVSRFHLQIYAEGSCLADQYSGQANPLESCGDFASEVKVLCFDEFFVSI